MPGDYPYHSDDASMDAEPVQSFVVPAIEMGPEELARPRHGRPPVRKPADEPTTPPAADSAGSGQPA
ncbi:MAG: hypothetical protein K2X82_32345 [Gemmataceae bacterium]|nr:hypothetical protein [Gemmataceae bacterium]